MKEPHLANGASLLGNDLPVIDVESKGKLFAEFEKFPLS